jgi:hypothetical protein
MESILFRDEPCNTLDSLWNALHSTYNVASGHECEIESLGEWLALPEREWLNFTPNEVQVTLAVCATNSAPGPDHVTWSHLKLLLVDIDMCAKIVNLANACFEHRHWPTFFKESSLVIIPKPGKLSYSAPKAFRPIMLLNTMGKLIEKCVLNHIQFDCVKFGVFQSNQFRGIMQRFTEDAGLYLTHLVKASWARGLKTSVIAFDIMQFFPSLNHGMLIAILRWSGFPEKVVQFFSLYLVNRETLYQWGKFSSPKMNADVGVWQGLALSPIESALYFAPVLSIFNQWAAHLDVTVLSYVDDGTLIVQTKSWDSNLCILREAYGIMFDLLTEFGLVLKHNKSELFHFSRKPGDDNPSLNLGYQPYTEGNPLKPKAFWRYLGFYFDCKLSFKEHVRYYSTKALTMVQAMGILGNSNRGLLPVQKRLLYKTCVLPVAIYGYRLWFHDKVKVKGLLSSLSKMQQKAALWIIGAFSMSPTGGCEAIAGLIPIHLHICRLADRSSFRANTLSASHPFRTFLGPERFMVAEPHARSIYHMTEIMQTKVKSSLMEVNSKMLDVGEVFEPLCPELALGKQFLDYFSEWVIFFKKPQGIKPEDWTDTLNKAVDRACQLTDHVSVFLDAFSTKKDCLQAALAAFIEWCGLDLVRIKHPASRATAPNVELFAIYLSLLKCLWLENVETILGFTDSMASAHASVDPSTHSGQLHSLAVIWALIPWLEANPLHQVQFWYVPSQLR